MGDHSAKSISADATLNRGPLALLLRRQYEFPFGINIVKIFNFSIFKISVDGLAWPRGLKRQL